MAKQKEPKKVLMVQGNQMEIGQALTNLYGMNPDLVIYNHFTTTGIRMLPQPKIITAGSQQQYEPITIIYLVYTNPGDLNGFQVDAGEPIRAKLKPVGGGEVN